MSRAICPQLSTSLPSGLTVDIGAFDVWPVQGPVRSPSPPVVETVNESVEESQQPTAAAAVPPAAPANTSKPKPSFSKQKLLANRSLFLNPSYCGFFAADELVEVVAWNMSTAFPRNNRQTLRRHEFYTYIGERMLNFKDQRHNNPSDAPSPETVRLSHGRREGNEIHVPCPRTKARERCLVCRLELGSGRRSGLRQPGPSPRQRGQNCDKRLRRSSASSGL